MNIENILILGNTIEFQKVVKQLLMSQNYSNVENYHTLYKNLVVTESAKEELTQLHFSELEIIFGHLKNHHTLLIVGELDNVEEIILKIALMSKNYIYTLDENFDLLPYNRETIGNALVMQSGAN